MSSVMPKSSQIFLNTLGLIGLLLLLCLIQTIVWFQIFYPVPSANLWLPVVVYISLHRPFKMGILTLYLVGFFLATLTSQPLYLLLLNLLCLYFGLQVLRLKFFWPGANYFVMVCTASVPLLALTNWILSLNFETNYLTYPRLGAWFSQLIMAPAFAPLIYWLLRRLDAWTQIPISNEYGFDAL